jgi:hypothetical protein
VHEEKKVTAKLLLGFVSLSLLNATIIDTGSESVTCAPLTVGMSSLAVQTTGPGIASCDPTAVTTTP